MAQARALAIALFPQGLAKVAAMNINTEMKKMLLVCGINKVVSGFLAFHTPRVLQPVSCVYIVCWVHIPPSYWVWKNMQGSSLLATWQQGSSLLAICAA